MFLIRYAKDKFINADTIQWVSFNGDRVIFGVAGDPEVERNVEVEFEKSMDYSTSLNGADRIR